MSDKPLLKTPGEMISEAREAQDLTIAQLSERTKIPPPVLSALELDEYHKISGPLYIKSFLRTCAMDLGLDPEAVLGLYNKISGEQRGGPAGANMIWEEEKVKVSHIGLPWMQIILAAGIVAILVGVGLFSLRGCGTGEGDRSRQPVDSPADVDVSAAPMAVTVGSAGDSASGGDPRRESLIPPQTETELKEMTEVAAETKAAKSDAGQEAGIVLADTLALGWMLSPPAPIEEKMVAAADVGPAADEPAPKVEIVAPGISQAENPVKKQPAVLPVEQDRIEATWPLVLRIVCDAPQRIQVKRDGDREFSEARWPAESATASGVPAAGFEAGRVYRQGDRLVVFWGAEDHFSLVLARTRGVEVTVNGRVRDIANLRAGQELILDSHSAGSGPGR